MYTILGSGFGLYGYLPALVKKLDQEVILPRAYEKKIIARPELVCLLPKIHWVKDVTAALDFADAVVIATLPMSQPELVKRCLTFSKIRKFVLEKPVASTPKLAVDLLNRISAVKSRYVIGYTFTKLYWQSRLLWPAHTDPPITITWEFMAHHFSQNLQNWKRCHSQGGGVLRFFGIQVIAMLAMRGYETVRTSTLSGSVLDEPDLWQATFTGIALPVCHVKINSRSEKPHFTIVGGDNHYLLSLTEPFAQESQPSGFDRRVSSLASILNELEVGHADQTNTQLFMRVNNLWAQAEAV